MCDAEYPKVSGGFRLAQAKISCVQIDRRRMSPPDLISTMDRSRTGKSPAKAAHTIADGGISDDCGSQKKLRR